MNNIRFIVRTLLKESMLNADYKQWKRRNVTIRGIAEFGEHNGAGAQFGDGLYTAALSNKDLAKKYGGVYFVVNAIPKNPKIFNNINLCEIWMQQNLFMKYSSNGYPSRREFVEYTTIESEMLKMGYDGIIIRGREMVNYKPENIKYFKTEQELISYFESMKVLS